MSILQCLHCLKMKKWGKNKARIQGIQILIAAELKLPSVLAKKGNMNNEKSASHSFYLPISFACHTCINRRVDYLHRLFEIASRSSPDGPNSMSGPENESYILHTVRLWKREPRYLESSNIKSCPLSWLII